MKTLLLAALVTVTLAYLDVVSEDDLIEWENFKVRCLRIPTKRHSAIQIHKLMLSILPFTCAKFVDKHFV